MAVGLGGMVAGGVVLAVLVRFGVFSSTESVSPPILAVLLPIEIGFGVLGGLVLAWGLVCVASALADMRKPIEVVGEVLRLRMRGDENHRRQYAAVDDGRSPRILAWRVSPDTYATLEQGQTVRADVTRFLRYVRSMDPRV
jgi:hypothetical protein